jgi:nitrous oxide reductase accessory protein NosL
VTRRVACAAALALLVLASACSEASSGPVRIGWGRHACDHCGMAISEQAFAAEVRVGPREVMRFDDLGCALAWLESKGGAAVASEFWVMDQDRSEWLDARSAFYRPDQRTPMAYGFGAIRDAAPGSVDFETARRTILERIRDRSAHQRP